MKPKTSPVWKYFIPLDNCNAQCKICERVYSRKGRTTTALKSHLKSAHIEHYNEFERLDEVVKLCLEAKKQKIQAPDEDDDHRGYSISPKSYEHILESATIIDTTATNDSAITASLRRASYRNLNQAIRRCKDELSDFDSGSSNEKISCEETAFDTFGCSVAMQLKNMSVENALVAQSRIQSILTEIGIADYRQKNENKLNT